MLLVAGKLKRSDPDIDEEAVLMRALRDFNTPKVKEFEKIRKSHGCKIVQTWSLNDGISDVLHVTFRMLPMSLRSLRQTRLPMLHP